jgi:hypothetical protein
MSVEIKKYAYVTYSAQPDNSNIIIAEYTSSLKVDLSIAKSIVTDRLDFTDNKEHYLVLDMSNIRDVSVEAKEYMQHPEGGLKNILSAAFIGENPVAELYANVYIKTPKNFEAMFFNNKKDAIQWLKECMRNNGPTSRDKIVSQ